MDQEGISENLNIKNVLSNMLPVQFVPYVWNLTWYYFQIYVYIP